MSAPRAGGDSFVVLVAGDLVFHMAHEAPRPERSTGQMMRGSDLDLVVILDDSAPASLEQSLDDLIYQQKYRYLINPSLREEIDYAIKRLDRVREQAEFRAFHDMVACKIIDEAMYLHGSQRLFDAAKDLVRERGIPGQLESMRERALLARAAAEERLLACCGRHPRTGRQEPVLRHRGSRGVRLEAERRRDLVEAPGEPCGRPREALIGGVRGTIGQTAMTRRLPWANRIRTRNGSARSATTYTIPRRATRTRASSRELLRRPARRLALPRLRRGQGGLPACHGRGL